MNKSFLIAEHSIIGKVDLHLPGTQFQDSEIGEKSTRMANYLLKRQIIAYKEKLNISWNVMTAAEYRLLKKIRRLHSFICTFYNDDTDTWGKMKAYCGLVTVGKIVRNQNGNAIKYFDIKANFIEF